MHILNLMPAAGTGATKDWEAFSKSNRSTGSLVRADKVSQRATSKGSVVHEQAQGLERQECINDIYAPSNRNNNSESWKK